MTKTIALITIHGMGDTEMDYYKVFLDLIMSSVGEKTWSKVILATILL